MKTNGFGINPPFCTCPELTWDHLTGRAEGEARITACRERAPLGIDPHPVIDPREAVSHGSAQAQAG